MREASKTTLKCIDFSIIAKNKDIMHDLNILHGTILVQKKKE